MLESKFQEKLIREIEGRFPGAIVLKNDSSYIQGFPDLIVLYKNHWAVLEVKNDRHADHQPNQDYYVGLTDSMSFGRFVFPENKKEVLYDLQRAFEA